MTTTDFIIIGSGIAGVRAAIELAPLGKVAVFTKDKPAESNTEYAQGGIAAALHEEDDAELHYQDTLAAGDGLCDPAAVRVLVEEGPDRIQELISWGAQFDREGGELAFTREAAHSRKRILHARGDATGQEINRALIEKLGTLGNVRVYPHCFAGALLCREGQCRGIRYLESSRGEFREMRARAVLLATGGIGQLYRDTTNPGVATGDGFALAFRAGAWLSDMEFVQFHPTALKLPNAPRFLLSEALRGEGAFLRNQTGERFMKRYHPDAELASRDVVSRSIFQETREGDAVVYLDLSHLDPDFVKRRFPRISEVCLQFGLDLARQPIPVFPAAHYMMGGIWTNLDGRTSLPGLFAAGEVACNGAHGANRLASNSLLDGLVFGRRAGLAMASSARESRLQAPGFRELIPLDLAADRPPVDRARLQAWMSRGVGVLRSAETLQQAADQLLSVSSPTEQDQAALELGNLLHNGRLVTAAARLREESRGGHFRTDYPQGNDSRWKCHLLMRSHPSGNGIEVATHAYLQDQQIAGEGK